MEHFFSGLDVLTSSRMITYKKISTLIDKTCNDRRIKKQDCAEWARAFGVRRRYRSKKELLLMTTLMWMVHERDMIIPQTIRQMLLKPADIPFLETLFVEGVFTSKKQRDVFSAVLYRFNLKKYLPLLRPWLPFPTRNRKLLLEWLCTIWFLDSSVVTHEPLPRIDNNNQAFVHVTHHDESQECTICLEPFLEGEGCYTLRRCACTMVYHHSCLTRWLRSHHSCPSCRATVVMRRI